MLVSRHCGEGSVQGNTQSRNTDPLKLHFNDTYPLFIKARV